MSTGRLHQGPTQTPTVEARLETMRARLFELPGQIILHPDDLRINLDPLEKTPNLEETARRILARGYGIKR